MNEPHMTKPSSEEAKIKDVLRTRARALARPPEQSQTLGSVLEVVEFRLAQERYAIEQLYVQEIYPFESLTPLPCVPAHVLGIVNLRGQILPVIDLKKFFDLPEAGITDLHMVIAVRVDDVELGILADAIAGVYPLSIEALQPSLPTLTGIRSQYLKGITTDQVVVLDVCKILRDPQLLVNDEVER